MPRASKSEPSESLAVEWEAFDKAHPEGRIAIRGKYESYLGAAMQLWNDRPDFFDIEAPRRVIQPRGKGNGKR